jgi:HEPN superfamily Apea-like protein/ApeA-like protein
MAFDRSMLDDFILRGRWKAPEWREWMPGSLEFSPQGGIRLLLDEHPGGPFEALKGTLEQSSRLLDTIHGVTTEGDFVTLLKARLVGTGFSGRTGGATTGTSRYHSLLMVLGEHLENSGAAKYHSVSVRYANLEEIVGFAPLSHSVEEDDRKMLGATVRFKNPQKLIARLDDYNVEAVYAFGTQGDALRSLRIDVSAWLTITSESEQLIDEFLKRPCKILSQLLGMSIGWLPIVVSIHAESRRNTIAHGARQLPNPSSIFFAQRPRSAAIHDIHPADLPFTLAGLGTRFEEVLARWQVRAAALSSSLDFFFSLDGDAGVAIEHHFLNATNAAESFHRSASPNQSRWSEDEFDTRLADILSRVSVDDREWLADQLRYANELRFRARVKEMFDQQPDDVGTVLGDRKSFVDKVVNTRNYLTHHDKDLEARAVRGAVELWRLTKGLRLILQSLFLQELGFSAAELSSAVKKLEDYKILAQKGR